MDSLKEICPISYVINRNRTPSKKIVNNFQNVEVLIVGDGTLKDNIYKIHDNETNLYRMNWQPYETIHEIYFLADIFVIPSRFEALPLSLLEAMAASLYIVYTPVGNMPDVLENYGLKRQLNSSTEEEIYAKLSSLLQLYETNAIGKSHILIDNIYDWENISNEIYEVYKGLAS